MSLRYLIDENLRGTLAVALVRVATRYGFRLDVLQIGDNTAPAFGTLDPGLLLWTELNNRVLISKDRRTLGCHLAAHLVQGGHSPGILLARDVPLIELADYLVLVAFTGEPGEFHDRICYVP